MEVNMITAADKPGKLFKTMNTAQKVVVAKKTVGNLGAL
ncbi:hypothetical protein M8C21_000770 [Ambrosia artemisiifolia]|uniref:Uncharacterized protein n=1 Tax=Ambrosia artemisiifolia TaxID=4212 RepID=A0AAD5CN69_AMBAR|nr:hypothetical protein M8C21_000770 [Ambrosia artemisiifolia]